jgi:hypothetical protein
LVSLIPGLRDQALVHFLETNSQRMSRDWQKPAINSRERLKFFVNPQLGRAGAGFQAEPTPDR